jgi:hypothetical protein
MSETTPAPLLTISDDMLDAAKAWPDPESEYPFSGDVLIYNLRCELDAQRARLGAVLALLPQIDRVIAVQPVRPNNPPCDCGACQSDRMLSQLRDVLKGDGR